MLELNKFFLIQLLYKDVFSLSYFESTAKIVMIVTFHNTDDIHNKGFSLKNPQTHKSHETLLKQSNKTLYYHHRNNHRQRQGVWKYAELW